METPKGYARVVTRYGGRQHLGRETDILGGRHQTVCMGTSSWTIESWEKVPDHPLLNLDEIKALPGCERCELIVGLQ